MITLTWQTVITAAAFVGAVAALLKSYNKGYDFVKRQKEQDKIIRQNTEAGTPRTEGAHLLLILDNVKNLDLISQLRSLLPKKHTNSILFLK